MQCFLLQYIIYLQLYVELRSFLGQRILQTPRLLHEVEVLLFVVLFVVLFVHLFVVRFVLLCVLLCVHLFVAGSRQNIAQIMRMFAGLLYCGKFLSRLRCL